MELQELSGNVLTYNNFHYKVNEIPEEFKLVFNAIDEETETLLINLIKSTGPGPSTNPSDKTRLKEILKCFSKEFYEFAGPNTSEGTPQKLKYQLNTQSSHVLVKGEGMPFIEHDAKHNPIVIVVNMGSDILFTLKDKTTQRLINIPLPRRSMFLLQDEKRKYQRGIAKRPFDDIGGNKIQRETRYSLLFESRK